MPGMSVPVGCGCGEVCDAGIARGVFSNSNTVLSPSSRSRAENAVPFFDWKPSSSPVLPSTSSALP